MFFSCPLSCPFLSLFRVVLSCVTTFHNVASGGYGNPAWSSISQGFATTKSFALAQYLATAIQAINFFKILFVIFMLHHSISYMQDRNTLIPYLFPFLFLISISNFIIFSAMKPLRSISSQTSCSGVVEAFAKSRWLRLLHLSHMENARTLENPFIVDAPENLQF